MPNNKPAGACKVQIQYEQWHFQETSFDRDETEQNRNAEGSEDTFSKYVRIYSAPKRTRQLIHPVGRCMIVGDSLQNLYNYSHYIILQMGIAVKGAEAEDGAGGTICFACNVTHRAKTKGHSKRIS